MNNRPASRPNSCPLCGPGLSFHVLSLVSVLSLTSWAVAQTKPAAPLPTESRSSILTGGRPAGKPIVREIDIRFGGTATVDRARILSRMRLKVGEPWTQEKEDDDLKELYSSGDIMNAGIETTEVAGGVKVTVTAEARPAMGDLVFQGNTVFHSDRLRDLVEFKAGGVVDDSKLSEAKTKILDLYKKKGYPDAVVTYSVEPGSQPGFSRIVFQIDEGGRGVIDQIVFEGNTVFSARKLRGEIESDNRNWLKFWDLKRKLDREKIERDMAAIQNFYGDHGYFDARVTGVEPVASGGDKVNLVFHIVEGPQYVTGGVGVTGNRIFETSTFLPVFQLEAGRTFSLADMKTDIETIQEFYGSRGYAEVKVTPRIAKRAGNQIFITYGIEEGSQFKVGKIHISGNQDTKPEVILRELAIDPGDEYNTIKIRKSMQRVKNLDYFEDNNGVDFMPVSSELGPDYKDINITVNEKKTGSLQFGAGFSSIDSLVGMVELTQKNFDITNWPHFTGGGQRFRLSLRAGSRRKDFMLSLTEPYFMGERLSLGTDLFWTEKTFLSDYFDQRDAGGNINLRKPLGDNTDIRLTYTLQQVEIYNIDDKASPAFFAEKGSFLQSRLGAAIVFDNRNSIQMPSRGHKFTFESQMSGVFLGGDVDTYTVSLSGQKYWKMPWNSIFSVEGKVAVVDGANGDRVPIFERQFLGGANNLRGFKYREVGPKDRTVGTSSYGEPLGGGTSAYLTAEYTFPIVKKVRGAVFADAGFVNTRSWDFNSSDLNADVGIGVRVVLPVIGPIKIDWGVPVRSDNFNDSSSGRFNFSVDYKF